MNRKHGILGGMIRLCLKSSGKEVRRNKMEKKLLCDLRTRLYCVYLNDLDYNIYKQLIYYHKETKQYSVSISV